MILKTENKTLEIKLKMLKVEQYENERCKDNETLLTLLPSKVMAKDRISFLIDFLNFFQIENGNKLSKEEIGDLLEDYLDENECDLMKVYTDIINELDVRGFINKGMGFTITKMLNSKMEEIKERMASGATMNVAEDIGSAN